MRLLAISWAMPPLLYPRAIQVSRLLGSLVARGIDCDVVHAQPGAPGIEDAPRDAQLADCLPGGFRAHATSWSPGNGPDWEAAWVDAAEARCERLLAHGGADLVASFAQPWCDHEIGRRLKQRHGLPWLAHFSDPWVDSPYYAHIAPAQRAAWTEAERTVIETADTVVFTNQRTLELVMAKYPAGWRDKAHVLFHGFDAALPRAVPPQPRTEAGARVCYVGNLFESRTQGRLFEAVRELRREEDDQAPTRYVFVGVVPDSVRRDAHRLGLDDVVRFPGPCAFREATRWMVSADVLLVIDRPAANSVFFPSKLVEYLAARRPILGITPPDGVTADILTNLGWPVVAPDDAEGIAAALRRLLPWRPGDGPVPLPDEARLAAFDIRTAAREMDTLLRRLLPSGRTGSTEASS